MQFQPNSSVPLSLALKANETINSQVTANHPA
jgi:hypothetical protein